MRNDIRKICLTNNLIRLISSQASDKREAQNREISKWDMKEETEFVKTALFNKKIKKNSFLQSRLDVFIVTRLDLNLSFEFTLCDVNIGLLWAFNSLGERGVRPVSKRQFRELQQHCATK